MIASTAVEADYDKPDLRPDLSLGGNRPISAVEAGTRRAAELRVDTMTRYAAAVGKHVLFQLADAGEPQR